MLNKLLKRCMPWMDKGRWYHIRVEGEYVSEDEVTLKNVEFDDRMFSRYESTPGFAQEVNLFFSDPNINASIIDYRLVRHVISPDYPTHVNMSGESDIILNVSTSGWYVGTYLIPGVVDLWLFIKTN